MDEKLNDQEVLLVVEKDSNELKAVTGLNEDGTPKTVKPEAKNEPEFLKIDKNGDVLENFFTNFMRQAKEPTHFHFFRVPLENLENMVVGLQELLKNPENPTNKQMLDEQRLMPENFAPNNYQPISESRIDWEQLMRIGITREQLVETNSLDDMLNFRKSSVLLPIYGNAGGVKMQFDARLSFRENPDGELRLQIHSVREQPELDQPIYGTLLTEEDKKNLLKTGHAGRLIEFNIGKDRTINGYVSIDKLTNEIVVLNAEKVRIPDKLCGAKISGEHKQKLENGEAVYLDNLISKDKMTFSAIVQIDADKRGLDFKFPDTKRQAQELSNKIKQGEVPNTFRNVKLSQDQQDSLKDGYTVYVSGMKDKKGRNYSGYMTLNKEQGKIDFMFPNQYNEALKSGLVIPDSRHKAQVAANNEGLKVEAAKKVDVPMEKGQTQPTEKQNEKLSNDKEKLQFVAKYGYEGIANHPKSNDVFNTAFMEKYNLKTDYGNASTIHYNSTFADTVAGTDSMLADVKQYSNKMKETASQELSKQEKKEDKKQDNEQKQEQKQPKKGRKVS